MGRPKTNNLFSANIPKSGTTQIKNDDEVDKITESLIKDINKEAGATKAYNLSVDEAPTNIKRWIKTDSLQLDYIISNKKDVGGFPEGRIIEIQGPPSCHAFGDRVMMFDGTIKNVEDVIVGDKLMGPDSQPRTVLKLVRGQDMLYRITPGMHAAPHHVSSKHLLPLVKTKKSHQGPERIEISVEDYLNANNWFKDSYSLERKEVKFAQKFIKDIVIPPYILGLLLGDGCLQQKRTSLVSADEIILENYTKFCNQLGYNVSRRVKQNNQASEVYHLNNAITGKQIDPNNDLDKIRSELRKLGLLGKKSGSKFIPQEYKIRSKEDQLELLAGLIDTDGHYSEKSNNYEYSSKSFQLAKDFVWVARAAGLKVGEPMPKIVNGTTYYRVFLSGFVPCKLARKQSNHKNTRQDIATHGFLLEPIGEGNIYGFTVDVDNLYLMEDTTVERNCGKSHLCFSAAKNTQKMGGIVVYIDTENATSPENLISLGIDVSKRFVFIQETCMEEIFKIIETTIEKVRNMKEDMPVLVVWDSVAGASPKAEIEGSYDQNTIGLAARVLSKGFRKITEVIGNTNTTLLLVNQQRMKIGVMYGDPCVSPETKIRIRRKINVAQSYEINKE